MDTRNVAIAAFAFGLVMFIGVVNYLGGKAQGHREAEAQYLPKLLQMSESCDELTSKLMERLVKQAN